jgi:hypothetical protein
MTASFQDGFLLGRSEERPGGNLLKAAMTAFANSILTQPANSDAGGGWPLADSKRELG